MVCLAAVQLVLRGVAWCGDDTPDTDSFHRGMDMDTDGAWRVGYRIGLDNALPT